jgi:peptidoglycan/LPS O-acetylase OafA/YrhL
VNELVLLGLTLAITAVAVIGAIIAYKTVWQPRRRRKLEREHFRSKLG